MVRVTRWLVAALVFGWTLGAGAQIPLFYTDFENGVPPELTGVTTLTGVQRFEGVGHPGNQITGQFLRNDTGGGFGPFGRIPGSHTYLTFDNLPPHHTIGLGFVLAVIDTWDGSSASNLSSFNDRFNILINGQAVFSESFYNGGVSPSVAQSYVPAAGVLLTQLPATPASDYGFSGFGDSAYDMSLEPKLAAIPHDVPYLTVEFFADGFNWEGGLNESWAIDNLRVTLDPVPEPGALALSGAGVLVLVRRTRGGR